MPGYLIHIATANKYYKKHIGEISNINEFTKGVITQDLTDEKFETHYGVSAGIQIY